MKQLENIIIPMGGLGKRFKKYKFNTIKPLIQIDDKCILEKSMMYLPKTKNIFKKVLINIKKQEADNYFEVNDLPKHPLLKKGYFSIGCEHCTVPGKGREGRWNNNPKNIILTSSTICPH